MLLPLKLFSSIKQKFHGVGEYYSTLPNSKKLQLILSVMSPFQTVLLKIFFGINYHDKINGCNFTKLTGMKANRKKQYSINMKLITLQK